MNYYSRLSRKEERRTIIQIGLIITGTVILLFSLFKFGLPLLFSLTSSIINMKPKAAASKDKSLEIVSPPILEAPYTATTSSSVKISGSSDPNSNVSIYVNDIVLQTLLADKDGKFDFSMDLVPGLNRLMAESVTTDGQKSTKSSPLDISYITKPPKLDIDTPSDKQTFNNSNAFEIRGTTDTNVSVIVNDRAAIVSSDGKFSLFYRFQNGENKLKFSAIDQAGNKTEKELTVYLQQ